MHCFVPISNLNNHWLTYCPPMYIPTNRTNKITRVGKDDKRLKKITNFYCCSPGKQHKYFHLQCRLHLYGLQFRYEEYCRTRPTLPKFTTFIVSYCFATTLQSRHGKSTYDTNSYIHLMLCKAQCFSLNKLDESI